MGLENRQLGPINESLTLNPVTSGSRQTRVQSAGCGETAQNAVNEFRSPVSRSDPGDISAIFADIVRNFHWVENNTDVKETEKDDTGYVQEVVKRHSLRKLGREACHELALYNRG
jgi:hypothetical protein